MEYLLGTKPKLLNWFLKRVKINLLVWKNQVLALSPKKGSHGNLWPKLETKKEPIGSSAPNLKDQVCVPKVGGPPLFQSGRFKLFWKQDYVKIRL